MQIKKEKLWNMFAFLFGVLSCNNIIYLFKVGNTYINIIYTLSSIFILFVFLTKSNVIVNTFKIFSKYLLIFSILVFLSFIPMILVSKSDSDYITTFFNGQLSYFLNIILYFSYLLLRDNKKSLLDGVWIGFSINIFFSLLSYFLFKSGNYFSLYNYFPQPAFAMPVPWQSANELGLINDNLKVIFSYRAQGLFLETSHYVAFLVGTFLLFWDYIKPSFFKKVVYIACLFLTIISWSANLVTLTFVILVYMIRCNKISIYKLINRKILVLKASLFFIGCSFLILILFLNIDRLSFLFQSNDFLESLIESFKTANLADSSNSERFTNMLLGYNLVWKYPFGVGYNMVPSLLMNEYSLRVYSTFNHLITTQLELGFLGTLVYCSIILSLSIPLLKRGRSIYQVALGVSVLGVFICQVANGIKYFPFILLLFALASMEIDNIRIKRH
ncbi:hypothetical protein [Desulfosporosinus nitroreducens]|uniref:hypothetical protein n=1 Tax=Desulfosporosinus nitroreducens TaxID=2018668 RepID=UPI00207CAC14|nr:hypothetical protein [Desulfosporosinus nitroreducens]MCO1600971.1 hypothetical protein [Desulfosporosinus nitroreducens]